MSQRVQSARESTHGLMTIRREVDPVDIATRHEYRGKHHLRTVSRSRHVVKAPKHPGVAGRRVVFIPIATALPGEGRDTIERRPDSESSSCKTQVGGGNGGELKAEYIDDTVFAGNRYL